MDIIKIYKHWGSFGIPEECGVPKENASSIIS